MKYLGIDYGTKRIGVAVSDEAAILAFPLGTVDAGKGALEEIQNIARENAVAAIVMGESKNFQGESNPIMREVEKFVAQLESAGHTVFYEPEFMTSAAAARFGESVRGRTERVSQSRRSKEVGTPTGASGERLDASAAALLLQSFLDRKKQRLDVE